MSALTGPACVRASLSFGPLNGKGSFLQAQLWTSHDVNVLRGARSDPRLLGPARVHDSPMFGFEWKNSKPFSCILPKARGRGCLGRLSPELFNAARSANFWGLILCPGGGGQWH